VLSFYSFSFRETDYESLESVMWGREVRRETFAALIAGRGRLSDEAGVNVRKRPKTNADAD
jgi:hypothetical protein